MGDQTYHEALDEAEQAGETYDKLETKFIRDQEELQSMSKPYPSALQPWLTTIPVMQQTVLLSAIRGPDGFRKFHPVKPLLRWYRRCVLMSAFEGLVLDNPYADGGGSFTGPSIHKIQDGTFATVNESGSVIVLRDKKGNKRIDWPEAMRYHVDNFLLARDEMCVHYYGHAMHAFQILGVHHLDPVVREFWYNVYLRMVNAMHLKPELDDELNTRLSDNFAGWASRSDEAGSCSE